jgi:hypothetical protein
LIDPVSRLVLPIAALIALVVVGGITAITMGAPRVGAPAEPGTDVAGERPTPLPADVPPPATPSPAPAPAPQSSTPEVADAGAGTTGSPEAEGEVDAERQDPADSGDLAAGDADSGDLAAGDADSGDLAAGDADSGDLAAGDAAALDETAAADLLDARPTGPMPDTGGGLLLPGLLALGAAAVLHQRG